MVAYSPAFSQPDLSLSAPANLSIVFTAHSSNDSVPFPFLSSLANALRRLRKQFLTLDAAVLVLVGAREALFLAALGGGFRRRRKAVLGNERRARPSARAALPEAAGSAPHGSARRGRLRSGAGNRPQPRPGNAPRRTSFNIRRFGMAKLASEADGVNCRAVTMPLHRWRSIAATRGGVPSGSNGGPDLRSRTASLAKRSERPQAASETMSDQRTLMIPRIGPASRDGRAGPRRPARRAHPHPRAFRHRSPSNRPPSLNNAAPRSAMRRGSTCSSRSVAQPSSSSASSAPLIRREEAVARRPPAAAARRAPCLDPTPRAALSTRRA